MYDGNQVLRFESKYKSADLGGLGVELTKRKGTGNYDPERTIFNYSYVSLSKPTLQEQVYSKLKDNMIKKGFKVIESNQTNYLCNNIYYNGLKYIDDEDIDCEMIFIHIPKMKMIEEIEKIANVFNEYVR